MTESELQFKSFFPWLIGRIDGRKARPEAGKPGGVKQISYLQTYLITELPVGEKRKNLPATSIHRFSLFTSEIEKYAKMKQVFYVLLVNGVLLVKVNVNLYFT